ncbi:hypothetical protein LUW74_26175 [Actinomadura madurae]|uniref:hypothetical protein n=1 Tax=Actinomadura madurae TaxID=1993 RepID=UPI002025C36D|nr:hypothetical protein [Actinomadura madurae]URN06467.1 hypothetical protein LUW74_26175 [Actinomadura madurae]
MRRQRRLAPHLRLGRLAVLRLLLRAAELVVGTGLRDAVLLLRLAVLRLRWLPELVLLLRLPVLVLQGRLAVLVLLGRLPELVLLRLLLVGVGSRRLLLLRSAPLVLGLLLLLLRHAPRVLRLLRLGRPSVLARTGLALSVLPLPLLGLPAILRLPAVLRLSVLALPLLLGGLLLGHGRPPGVRLLLLLRRAPRVRLLRGWLLRLLLVRVGLLRLPVLGLAVLRLPVLRGAVRLALLRTRRRGDPLLVVPARTRLGRAATGAREVGPAAHAEQIARLERFVTDGTVQGRHDTSPERTPARSSLDVRCSMSPLRGIPM